MMMDKILSSVGDTASVTYTIIQANIEYIYNFDIILFYTFITILFGILLTFERSRCLLMHVSYVYQYPINIRKLFKYLTKFNHLTTNTNATTIEFKHKVKRLGSKLATNTVLPINNYLIKPLFKRRFKNEENTSCCVDNRHRHHHDYHLIYRKSKKLFDTSKKFVKYSTYTSISFSSSIKSRANKFKLILSQNRKLIKYTPKSINSRVKLYKKLPLRSMSRLWGTVNSIDLPVWMRKPCYLMYAWVFNCNLNEMDIEDLRHFKNLSEFFRRKLKPNARVVDASNCLISPCDGKVLHFGKVDKGYLEQVKGVNYSLKAFLGDQNWRSDGTVVKSNEDNVDALYQNTLKHKSETELYHCVIYLAPGDYHRFHSPTEWNIKYRRHFPGELFSVNPSIARWLQGLFSLNERVVYYGDWKYGFFSMTPVGATNVGSIRVYFDPVLETNLKPNELSTAKLEKSFCLSDDQKGVKLLRGDYFGEFNLGSTIVLIFEAPKSFEFKINQNQKVLFGQPLGSI